MGGTGSVTTNVIDHAPVITTGPAAVAVPEEGLPNGVADTLPSILDTTNSPTASGTITASDTTAVRDHDIGCADSAV